MKITFSNLGAIKKTTLDLRPLTVIIGPNNSNKTYIAYSIYGLLTEIRGMITKSLLTSLGYDFPNDFSPTNNKLYKIDDKGTYSLKINERLLQLFTEDCNELTRKFRRELQTFFQDSSKILFKDSQFDVKFTKNEFKKYLEKLLADKDYSNNDNYKFTLKNDFLNVDFVGNEISKNDDLAHYVASSIVFGLKSFLYPTPFVMPAERNALIITYKVLESRRYDLLKEANRNLFGQPSLLFEGGATISLQNDIQYPQPIEDFLKFLTNLELENRLENGDFIEFANRLEEKLQQNNKTEYVLTKSGDGREIKVNVKKGLDIDLYNASSSIKQLAPLLLYLRYRAQENDLLIIDEPEMNLHPESQAKLLEVLGMLVNAGVNVLLTTHSPYFMSHLNNLIAGDMTDEKTREKQAKSLYLQDARAFLKPEDVSAYEMRQNKAGNQTLHDLHDKDYGIRWDTLSDVSADIQQKFFEIYEKGAKTSKGK